VRRLAFRDLQEWADAPSRRPLVLRGARQVGKTWLVESFAKEHLGAVATLNLERHAKVRTLLADPSPRENLAAIESLLGKRIVPGQCLLFFDEIQACPELLPRLRYFHEELPDLHVVAAGSLLDFALAEHESSMPVGRICYLHLGPLSFPEFVTALAGEPTTQFLHSLRLGQSPPAALHEKLLGLVRDYMLVGGMPAVVDRFRVDRSHVAANRTLADLLQAFQDDFARYGTRIPADRLRTVLASVARQVGTKFMWSAVDREERAQALRAALDALCRARLCRRVACTHGNGIPLGADVVEKEFKVTLLDTGLLQSALGLVLQAGIEPGALVHEGPVAEHLVGQMLADNAPRHLDPSLWYWTRHRHGAEAEVDYLVQHGTEVVPIEVKAGATGTLRSLHRFVAEKRARLAVRVSSASPQFMPVTANVPGHPPHEFDLLSIPFYLVPMLPRLLEEALVTGAKPQRPRPGRKASPPKNRTR
jgi:predicted AAA+ superfamily ATPase